jgi:hypothetical protein
MLSALNACKRQTSARAGCVAPRSLARQLSAQTAAPHPEAVARQARGPDAMGRGLALAALALAAGAAIASAAVPAPSDFRTSAFVCPAASMTNTSCACTSGCSINSEFSYLWSNPVYPPPLRWLGPGAVSAACADNFAPRFQLPAPPAPPALRRQRATRRSQIRSAAQSRCLARPRPPTWAHIWA